MSQTREAKCAYMKTYDKEHREDRAAYYQLHKEDYAAYRRTYYLDHRDSLLERSAKESAEFTEGLRVLRTNSGCEDCETHQGKLEHHHVDPETKRFNVSEMHGCSPDSLEEELEKCVILCVPCHNKRHVAMRTF